MEPGRLRAQSVVRESRSRLQIRVKSCLRKMVFHAANLSCNNIRKIDFFSCHTVFNAATRRRVLVGASQLHLCCFAATVAAVALLLLMLLLLMLLLLLLPFKFLLKVWLEFWRFSACRLHPRARENIIGEAKRRNSDHAVNLGR